MGKETGISWTDHSFNPWWGCQKVSPACANCYAETFSKRYGMKLWGPASERRFFGPKHWEEPLKWNKQAQKEGVRRRVFCASMADVFEDRDDLIQPRADLFLTVEETPHLDWLLLTKRPENIEGMLPKWSHLNGRPFPNVWYGTTVENQEQAALRVPLLLQVPAVVRFISYEPALGPLDLTNIEIMGHSLDALRGEWCANRQGCFVEDHSDGSIDWVIAGGESGGRARPSQPEWFTAVRDQCAGAGVAFHFKQWGEWIYPVRYGKKAAGRTLDGREWLEFPTQKEIA